MATISFANLTIPTPQPYDKKEPTQNQENFFYVALQLLNLAKQAGFQLSDQTNGGNALDLSKLIQAVKDLRFNGKVFDFGDFLYEQHLNTYTIEE